MTTYNVRCTWRRGCGKHFTLKKHPDAYKRYPKCPACKRGYLNLAPYSKIETQKRTCRCSGIPWPHKRGTILNEREFCVHAEFDVEFGPYKVRAMKPTDPCPF